MDLYGLLYVADGCEDHANLGKRSDPIDIYLRCAITCGRSVAAQGSRFRLVTNDAAHLQKRAAALGLEPPELVEHVFAMQPRRELGFYSAHFKLELFAQFASGSFGAIAGLIDIDTVLLRPLDLGPLPSVGLFAYELTDVIVPSYGHDRVSADLTTVIGYPVPQPRWWGGEFLLGSPAGFAALVERTQACWPRYIAAADALHHVGDEMVTSAAIVEIVVAGAKIGDAGRPGGVVRWWSTRMDSVQPALADVLDRSLLHLPADKPFLSEQANRPFSSAEFVSRYRRHVRRKIWLRRLAEVVDTVKGRPRKHLPKLG
jgi:hypothetical protein